MYDIPYIQSRAKEMSELITGAGIILGSARGKWMPKTMSTRKSIGLFEAGKAEVLARSS